MGFADSPTTRSVLANYGVRVSGYVWRWAPGLKGGTYPPHYHQNGDHAPTADSFEAYPGEDVNGSSCMCNLPPVYRNPDGTFARPDNLVPVFQPPVTASLPAPIDWTPLREVLTELADRTVTPTILDVRLPDGAFVVNLPPLELYPTFKGPDVHVAAAEISVQPKFSVEAPTVNVQPPVVNVAAPNVTVEPRIEVKPVVKVIREKVAKAVRFRRNTSGQITEAEVVEDNG